MKETVFLYAPNGDVQIYENATDIGFTDNRIAFTTATQTVINSNLRYMIVTSKTR